MRRVLILVLPAALALSACATAVTPRRAVPYARLSPGDSLDQAGPRAAVADFLHAYASAPTDQGAGLEALAGSPWLTRWAHWLVVQDAVFPGSAKATAAVQDIGPAILSPQAEQWATSGIADAREIALRATVSYTYSPTQGQPLDIRHVLDGPITVAPAPDGSWKVVDFTRDGVALSQDVFVVPHTPQSADGVELQFDTLILGPTGLQMGFSVSNGTGNAITAASIGMTDSRGNDALQGNTVPVYLPQVPAGGKTEGLVLLPGALIAQGQGLTLDVPFDSGARRIVVEVPLDPLLSSAGRFVTPSASPTP